MTIAGGREGLDGGKEGPGERCGKGEGLGDWDRGNDGEEEGLEGGMVMVGESAL